MPSSLELIAHTGCFELDLRYTCIVLCGGLLCLLGIEAILSPKVIQYTEVLVDWTTCFTCNVVLMIGVTIRNKWIIGIWLITLLVVFIVAPVTAIIRRFSKTQQHYDDPYLMFCEYMLHLCVYFITGRYVISYIMELRNLEELEAQHQRHIESVTKRAITI